jgi:hypothetical protein
MADDNTTTTVDDGGETGRIQSIKQIQAEQAEQRGKIDQILGILSGNHADAQQATEDKLDAPADIASMVRRQLDERDAKAKAAAAAKGQTDRLGALETRVSELAEKPPAAPVRRIEKFMGWGA